MLPSLLANAAVACLPLPLYLAVVEDKERLPVRQPRVGVAKVRPVPSISIFAVECLLHRYGR